MRGIVLAGGLGSRLYPSSKAITKQLLPIYDKPAIFYPLSILMLAGIREILVISTPRDIPMISNLLGNGSELGLNFSYDIQQSPRGIAEAFVIGEQFIGNDPVALILGDNLFYGHELTANLTSAAELKEGAKVFAYRVNNPQAYGVVEFDKSGKAISIEEKPKAPKSNYAVTGLYFYDNKVSSMARLLKPSARGEFEITDLNRLYMERGELDVAVLGRGVAWLDTGTPETLLSSAQFVQTIEERQGLKIACLEEIAYFKNFIDKKQLIRLAEEMPNCSYSQYLRKLIETGQL